MENIKIEVQYEVLKRISEYREEHSNPWTEPDTLISYELVDTFNTEEEAIDSIKRKIAYEYGMYIIQKVYSRSY
jgi:hypothetical protein